jgi:hypothetical protein
LFVGDFYHPVTVRVNETAVKAARNVEVDDEGKEVGVGDQGVVD